MPTDGPRPPPGKRPRKPLSLTPEERSQLEIWRDTPTRNIRRAARARVILACAETPDAKKIAASCDVALWTVYQWRTAFLERRLESFFKFLK